MILTLVKALEWSLAGASWFLIIVYPAILQVKRGISYEETRGYSALGWLILAVSDLLDLATDIYQHSSMMSIALDLAFAAAAICFAIINYRMWRRNKKKLRKLLGEKAKALLKAVTDQMEKLSEGVRQPLPAGV